MRIPFIAAVAAFSVAATLAGSVSAFCQSGRSTTHKKVLGYQDTQTGEFHPLSHVVPEATAPTTGTIELAITITLKTAVPTGGTVLCSTDITASSEDEATATDVAYSEHAYAVATVSGSTATCTVNTPYSWTVPAPGTGIIDELEGSYTVEIVPASTSVFSVAELEGRSSASEFVSTTKFPATGAITKYTVAVTL